MNPTDGVWLTAGRAVHWRFGWVATPERALASRVAREWVEDLVRRHALFTWTGIEHAEPGVKPRFAGGVDADFSVSHSGRAVMVAVGAGAGVGVGVDVEAAPFHALESDALLRRMCSEREAEIARSMPPTERVPHLAQLWTAKEAAVKATAAGLAHDFRTFEFDLPPSAPGLSAIAHLALALDGETVVSRVQVRPDAVRQSDAAPVASRSALRPQLTT